MTVTQIGGGVVEYHLVGDIVAKIMPDKDRPGGYIAALVGSRALLLPRKDRASYLNKHAEPKNLADAHRWIKHQIAETSLHASKPSAWLSLAD